MSAKNTALYSFKSILFNKKFILFVWILLPLIAGVKHSIRGVFNDYLIYKSVFYHTIEQVNLYLKYPELNGDSNHYGPIFSLVFAPYALLPDSFGTILWDVSMSMVLFFAIYKLPINWSSKFLIYYLSLQGLYANAVNSETNALIASLIIGSFICIRSEKNFIAAFFICLGVFIKLYTIVGLAFFFFCNKKLRFLLYLLFWSILLFVLPMLISSPQFIFQSYCDWYESLVAKNVLNIYSINQDISVMGLIRRVFGVYNFNNLLVLIPGIILFLFQYSRVDLFQNINYQLNILASTLLFVVIFSTGSEACTYIIPTLGAAIFITTQDRPLNKWVIFFIAFIVLTLFFSSGLSPKIIRNNIVKKYALEVLPFFITWIILVYQLVFKTSIYSKKNSCLQN